MKIYLNEFENGYVKIYSDGGCWWLKVKDGSDMKAVRESMLEFEYILKYLKDMEQKP